MDRKYRFRIVRAIDIIGLRHRILRHDKDSSAAHFSGDDDHLTYHFAIYDTDNQVICCVSYMVEPYKGKSAYRLRGMATDENMQNKGLGKYITKEAEKLIRLYQNIDLFWCDARESAHKFYLRQGWSIDSPLFEIPDVGPHYKMIKKY